MAEGVAHAPVAVTVELSGEWEDDRGACVDGALEGGIDVGATDHEFRRDTAERIGGFVVFGIFIRKHDERTVDGELGVADTAAVGIDEAIALHGAKGLFVEFDGLRGIANREGWSKGGIFE